MLDDIIERINSGGTSIENFAVNCHIPQKAIYVLVNRNMEHKIISTERFRFNSKYCLLDFYSRVLNTNKCLDNKRKVLSNNYLTFFTKRPAELNDSIIDYYYTRCEAPADIYKNWVKDNLNLLIEHTPKNTILKVFFEDDFNKYIELGKKYYYKYCLNKPVTIDGIIYGSPLTVNLNEKKPYAISRCRTYKTPILVTQERGFEIKCLLDFLKGLTVKGCNAAYIKDNGEVIPVNFITGNNQIIKREYNLIFIAFKSNKQGSIDILDMDILPQFSSYLSL